MPEIIKILLSDGHLLLTPEPILLDAEPRTLAI